MDIRVRVDVVIEIGEVAREAKITQTNGPVFQIENIRGFDVAVNDSFGMEVVEALAELDGDVKIFFFVDYTGGNLEIVRKSAFAAVVHLDE